MNGDYDTNFDYDFAIIGAGIAGAMAFYNLTKEGLSCIIIEKRSQFKRFFLSKLVCEHDFTFMPDIPKQNSEIFVRDHWTSIYASRNIEALVNGKDFNAPLGKIADEYHLIRWYLDNGEKNGGKVRWEQSVETIQIQRQEAILNLTSKNKTNKEFDKIRVKAVILATGASGINLQRDLGFQIPTILNSITATFKSDPLSIEKNIPADYIFRLHPQISLEGMLWLNRAKNYFNIGYVSKEDPDAMGLKFLRILQNYKIIRPYFKGLEKQVKNLKPKDFTYKKCTKYPITRKSSNRIIVIGDAAGLLYPLYLEGIVGAAASAKIASEVLINLDRNNKKCRYNEVDLKEYERQLSTRLLKSYFKMGIISDEMFFRGKEKPPFTIWDAYLNAINDLELLRKNIWIAYRHNDLGNYPEENDIWCGEQIYKRLPVSKKVSLMPFFLKFKFIK
ncbi:MAG: NAD(P)/FAD-dependent oxidoreductase [Promethearchaeota archaeon]